MLLESKGGGDPGSRKEVRGSVGVDVVQLGRKTSPTGIEPCSIPLSERRVVVLLRPLLTTTTNPQETRARLTHCDPLSSPMPHRIFFVEELVVVITEKLIECSYSKWGWDGGVVSLALTCRALESPVLSVLWARQITLSNLIQVLPQGTLGYTPLYETSGGFSTEELVRSFSPP